MGNVLVENYVVENDLKNYSSCNCIQQMFYQTGYIGGYLCKKKKIYNKCDSGVKKKHE